MCCDVRPYATISALERRWLPGWRLGVRRGLSTRGHITDLRDAIKEPRRSWRPGLFRMALTLVATFALASAGCGTDESVASAATARAPREDRAAAGRQAPVTRAASDSGIQLDESVSRGAVSAPTPSARPSAVPKTSGTRISSYGDRVHHEAHFPCGPFLGPGFDNYLRSFLQWTSDGSRLVFERDEQLWVIGQMGQGLKRLVDPNPSSPPAMRSISFRTASMLTCHRTAGRLCIHRVRIPMTTRFPPWILIIATLRGTRAPT